MRPLAGLRVLDVTEVLAGPLCTRYLGDLGADVVKVEPPATGDDTRRWPTFRGDTGAIFLSCNRNKRSLALDLKTDEGRRMILEYEHPALGPLKAVAQPVVFDGEMPAPPSRRRSSVSTPARSWPSSATARPRSLG